MSDNHESSSRERYCLIKFRKNKEHEDEVLIPMRLINRVERMEKLRYAFIFGEVSNKIDDKDEFAQLSFIG